MSANEDEQYAPVNIVTVNHPEEHVREESYYVEKYELDRWEHLYQKDNQLRSKREQEIKRRNKEYTQIIMQEWSFHPKLYKNDKYDKYIKNEYIQDTYERTTQWKDNVDQKVHGLKEREDKLK
jgi:hypothetical protein